MRAKHIFLVAAFVAIIFGVGVIQAAIELTRRERPQFTELFLRAPTETNLRVYEHDLEDASWFAEKLRPWMQYVQYLALKDAGEDALVGREDWLFYKPGVEYAIEPWADEAGAVAAVVAFRDRLAQRGIQLLVVPAPGKASVYPEMLTARAADLARPVHQHTLELMARLQQAGIEVVDLFEVFLKAKEAPAEAGDGNDGVGETSNPDVYLAQDTHWSPRGVRLAAETVARRLLQLGWMAKGEVAYDVKPVTLQRRGDIVQMTQSPQVERRFAPEEVHCTQVIRRGTGEPYHDDPQSPILVLGDSFLRIYERDEPGVAGFIAHLARELGMPLASIVNDGGASTLVRQELHRKPELLANKNVIVWEFVERDIRFGTEGWQDVPLPEPVKNAAAH